MTLDTLIAIIALLSVVYAVVPRSTRLDLRFRLHLFDWLLILALVIAVHVLLFYPSLQSIDMVPNWPLSPKTLTPAQSAYFLILIVCTFLIIKVSMARLSRRQIFALQRLVEELIQSDNFAELFPLLEKNLTRVSKILNRDFLLLRLIERIKQHVDSTDCERVTPDLLRLVAESRGTQPAEKDFQNPKHYQFTRGFCKAGRTIIAFFPEYIVHSNAAHSLMRDLLLSEKVVNAVATNRPYFALRLLDLDLHEKFDFLDLYLRKLIADPHSILYCELRANQNLDCNHNYWLPESNRLLFYFFSNARRAEQLGVWQPVGEYVIWHLDELAKRPEEDIYNHPIGDFSERGKWRSPIFAGIFFFDIMVSSALHQGVRWHMWLYYFTHFVERIIKNSRPIEHSADPLAEWPTPYHYLLYKIIEALTDWLEAAESLPQDQENVKIKELPLSHENDNIPKSAAFALTKCLRTIALADQVSVRFRYYIMDMFFRTYFTLRTHKETEELASVIIVRLSERSYNTQDMNKKFCEVVLESLRHHDKFHYKMEYVKELENALHKESY